MSFELFFGLFGLISSDSRSRHESRLETDWRLFTPIGASLFREHSSFGSSFNEPDSPLYSSSKPVGGPFNLTAGLKVTGLQSTQTPTNRNSGNASNSGSEGVFMSNTSSSSSASIVSSDSASTTRSTATLTRAGSEQPVAASPADTLRSPKSGAESGRSQEHSGASKSASVSKRARRIYCRIVCLTLWLNVIRLLVGLVLEKTPITLDFYYLGTFRIHFLIPALCLAIQVAAVSLIFIRNNDETNWLVPFYSSKDYLIRSRSNFRPKIDHYKKRVNVSVALALSLAAISSASISAYLINCALQSELLQPVGADEDMWNWERPMLIALLVCDVLWAIYATHVCFMVSFYFNLICSIMKSRFHTICKIIEDLAESDTSKTTNQARKITTLYLEHNEACELLDESNDFWQYLIFFTYFTYIPAYCYCLYNLFFVDFEAWPSFITWVIHTHTGLIILLISFSAAGVSTEAHAPYISLHTLSLIQLPLDVEVNIATFLHRVRGLTIGYSCYDLFAITNASMSNTAAACASYFLIVADFSRSSVFTLAQMNSSSSATGGPSSALGPPLASSSLLSSPN